MSRVSVAQARRQGASRVEWPQRICKARNEVVRACAAKPIREATLLLCRRVTRRSSGSTTSLSSCLAAQEQSPLRGHGDP
jgi:hypothetical protein